MTNLLANTRELMKQVYDEKTKKYLLISDFGDSIDKSEIDPDFPLFRTFKPVKPEKNRKLNSVYGGKFDIFRDSLMDYPSIIQYKLDNNQKDWEYYNRLVSFQIARCSLNCWHCYLYDCLKNECGVNCKNNLSCDHQNKHSLGIKESLFNGKEIVNFFLRRREIDAKNNIQTNVLRISGGEPFLAPSLILDILNEIQVNNLQNEIFVWAETSLIPLIVQQDGEYVIADEFLRKLNSHKNFCVHPCFHGLDSKDFEIITGQKIGDYDQLFVAFSRLLTAGIDVYPTFGSNVSDSSLLNSFYAKISQIHPLLPLKFALVEYSANYEGVKVRIEQNPKLAENIVGEESKNNQIETWNMILKNQTGFNYADIPRQLIPVFSVQDFSGSVDEEIPEEHIQQQNVGLFGGIKNFIGNRLKYRKSIVHLFKWPSYQEYTLVLLEIIALPIGSKGHIHYKKKWVNKEFEEAFRFLKGKEAIFWILSCHDDISDPIAKMDFAVPFRLIKILEIQLDANDYFNIDFIALDYFKDFQRNDKEKIKEITKIPFGSPDIPIPGVENGFVYVGPSIQYPPKSKDFNLETLFTICEPIQNSVRDQCRSCKIGQYPLLKIIHVDKGIQRFYHTLFPQWKKTKFDRFGYLKLIKKNDYILNYSFFQGESHRSRNFKINSEIKNGKSGDKKLTINEEIVGQKTKMIKVEIDNQLHYSINLPLAVATSFFKSRLLGIVIIILIVVGALYGFILFVPDASTPQIFTVAIPLLVVILTSIVQLFF